MPQKGEEDLFRDDPEDPANLTEEDLTQDEVRPNRLIVEESAKDNDCVVFITTEKMKELELFRGCTVLVIINEFINNIFVITK
jgi:hypothetical protein